MFNRLALLERAELALAAPPALPWIVRPDPIGDRVQRFVLPLGLCKTTNSTRQRPGWAQGKDKASLWSLMLGQAGGLRSEVLPGRPQVICIRFSPTESDPCSDWAKAAVDHLRFWRQKRAKIGRRIIVTKVRGLGFIEDDRGSKVALSQHWEPAPVRQGFVLIEVWTGKAVAA